MPRTPSIHSAAAAAATALALLVGTGCPRVDFDIAGALPEDKAVKISVPDTGSQGGQPLLGQRSDLYDTTYNISRGLNGGVIGLLGTVRWITSLPATKKDGDTWTWGPSQPSGLERISWRFQATKVADGRYTFKLEGRPKSSSAEEDFRVVYDGDLTKGATNPQRGHGSMNVYFDQSQALEQKVCGNGNRDVLEGRAAITFAADANPKTVTVDFVDFRNLCDGADRPREPAKYLYAEADDGSGNFQFTAHGNIHREAENKPLVEDMTIRSRWTAAGAGRSDLTVGGGEVPADMQSLSVPGNSVIVTECWDNDFLTVFQTTEPEELPQQLRDAIRPTQGAQTDCVFAQAELPDAI